MYITLLRLEQNLQTRRLDGSSLTNRRKWHELERQSDWGNLAVLVHLFLHQPGHSLDLAEDSKDKT